MLRKNATSGQIFKVLTELEDRFPQHDFVAGDARSAQYEQNILATLEPDAVKPPDPADVAEVSFFFRLKLREIEGWRPS